MKIASALSRLFFPAAVLLLAGITSADEGHDAATPDTAAVDTAAYSNHPLKVARAMRASTAPDLDGRLDDAVWSSAPVQSGFVQRDPDAGTPSSEKTEFMIVYDDEAIYIGAMMYDSAPDSISTALARRDDWRRGRVEGVHHEGVTVADVHIARGPHRDGVGLDDGGGDARQR
ncbi:MAG: hypothetical protein HOH74_19050, partial [Gemmatimonadetes bacterium]|nr:hypothetical protein [Gemmatimonadota bacterium]